MSRVIALLTLVLSVGSFQTVASPFDPARMRQDTALLLPGSGLGSLGVAAVDADGLGPDEVLVANGRSWAVLALGPSGKLDLVVTFHYFGTSTCWLLRYADADGDGQKDVVALVSPSSSSPDVDLVVYDLRTGDEKGRQRVLSSYQRPNDLLVGNAEGGPEPEIFVINRDDLWMLRLGEPTVWTFAGGGGTSLALGNLDADPEVELVVATGASSTAMILEPALRRVEWVYTPGFGTYVTAADVDADGRADLFGVSGGKVIRVDGATHARRWTSDASAHDWARVLVGDLEGDGQVDLVATGTQSLRLDAGTGAAKILGPYISGPAEFINLGICQVGLLWYSWDGLTGWSAATGETRTIGPPQMEPNASVRLAVGPLRGDGRTKLLWSSYTSSSNTVVGVMDLHHAAEEERRAGGYLFGPMAVAQLDADAPLEYAVPQYESEGNNKVWVLDGRSHALEWATGALYQQVSALSFGDVDGDGAEDLVVGTIAYRSGFVRLYRATTGVPLWKSAELGGEVTDLAVGDVDGVAGQEILVAVSRVGLYAFDGKTRQQAWLIPNPDASAVAVGNLDGDSDPDFVLGTANGGFVAYDGPSRTVLFQGAVGTDVQVNALRVLDVDGDGVVELVVAYGPMQYSSGDGGVAIVRLSDQAVLWRSPVLRGRVGSGAGLFVGDADDDGKTEIVVGTQTGALAFEYDPGEPDTQPPVWNVPIGAVGVAFPDGCCPELELSWGVAFDAHSPPVSYRVHRGALGFVPSDGSLVAQSSASTYRDRGLAPSTAYDYVVRAMDRLGNEEVTDVRVSVTTPPEVSLVVSPVDPTICPIGRVQLEVVASEGTPSNYRWYRNGQYFSGGPTFWTSTEGVYHCVVKLGACESRPSRPTVVTVLRKPGDATGDCAVTMADMFALSAYLSGDAYWLPTPVTDVDGNGTLNAQDLDLLVDHILGGGPPPAP